MSVGVGDDIVSGPSIFHPGGVNVLMGDGSARFVKETIQSWPLGLDWDQPAGATFPVAIGSWRESQAWASGKLSAPEVAASRSPSDEF